MHLTNCNLHRQRAPRDATYIGREMPKLGKSRLANPFREEDGNPLEKYRRRLCRQVIQGFAELDALRELRVNGVLACWCVDREAVMVRRGLALPETLCHGDIVFTVWTTLRELGHVPQADFSDDFAHANKVWRELYEACFHTRMLWGNDHADQLELERRGAA